MATRNSIVGFSAREQGVSSDLVRIQKVASRELQNVMRDASRAPDKTGPSGGSYYDVDANGAPVTGCRQEPTLAAVAATNNVTVGPGEVEFSYGVGVGADDSDYQVVRWSGGVMALDPADPVNPRIDLIVAIPGEVSTDLQARNILLDPVARTITSQNVYKTVNPEATLAKITGTPAGFPVPAALPAGQVALFEVYVHAAAADSTAFSPTRRTWRRIEGPFASSHGVLRGVKLIWSQENDETTSSEISVNTAQRNELIIDGEFLRWGISPHTTVPAVGIFQDLGGNDPFVGAAPAFDEPYYIYAVGGKNAPQLATTPGVAASPVAFVESTIGPNAFGYPNGAVRDPRTGGTTIRGALFVGVGYVVAGSFPRRRKGVANVDGWVYPLTGSSTTRAFSITTNPTAAAAAAVTNVPVLTAPSLATVAKMGFFILTAGGAITSYFVGHGDAGAGAVRHVIAHLSSPGLLFGPLYEVVDVGPLNSIDLAGNANTPIVSVLPRGYNMGVPRVY